LAIPRPFILGGTAAAAATTALITETTATTMNLFNLKTAAAILGAAAVTGTTTYFVQERETERLRADYQTFTEAHGKLADEQREAMGIIQLRDREIVQFQNDVADIPKMRAEIDALRGQLAQLHETGVPNNQLAASEARQPPADPISGQETKTAYLRELGRAVIMHAHDNQGLLPASLRIDGPLAPYFGGMQENGVTISEVLNLDDYEVMTGFVVQQGDLQRDYAVNSQTIVLRERMPRYQEGKFERLYVTATLGVIVKSAKVVSELEAWENEHKPENKGL
jgi:hypothetical protein